MGAGRSKAIVNKTITEYDNGEEVIEIDVDEELRDKLYPQYRDGLMSYNLTPEELTEYLNSLGIRQTYSWGIEGIDFVDGKADFTNVPIKYQYGIYTALTTASIIENKFREITGCEIPLTTGLTFADNDNGDNWNGLAHSVTDYVLLDPSFGKEQVYNTHIDILLNDSTVLDPQLIRAMQSGQPLSNHQTALATFIRANNLGWHPVGGAFTSGTTAHEYGHAVYNLLTRNNQYNLGRASYLLSENIEWWYENTFNSPVSGYSQHNPQEAFAECFSLYVYGGHSNSEMYQEFTTMMRECGLEDMRGIL